MGEKEDQVARKMADIFDSGSQKSNRNACLPRWEDMNEHMRSGFRAIARLWMRKGRARKSIKGD